MPDGERNGKGPTWMWIVGVLSTIVGVGVAAFTSTMWQQMNLLDQHIEAMNQALIELKEDTKARADAIQQNQVQIAKLWEKTAADHEVMMQDHYKLSVDDDWINAQARANRAIRELHSR